MPVTSDFAPGKIILCGEYAVVFGATAVAVPSKIGVTTTVKPTEKTGVTWRWPSLHDPHPEWSRYIDRIIDLTEKREIACEMIIEHALPLGRGMGSSTALVVSIARALLGADARNEALAIENHVNPGNSGIDFSVIWEDRPIAFSKTAGMRTAPLDTSFLEDALLIDTGAPDQTTPELVAWVRERQTELTEPIRIISECSRRLIDGEDVKTVLKDHHRAQVALGVVPPETAALIESIERAGGFAKVIGAGSRTGGGGMVLCLGLEESALKTLTSHEIRSC